MRSGNSRARWLRLAVFLLFAGAASQAEAHTVATTKGPIFAGLKHFFLSPDDVLAAVALGLLAGLRGSPLASRSTIAFTAAWFAAGLVGCSTAFAEPSNSIPSACSLLVLGILVACDLSLPSTVLLSIAVVAGALHGFLNGLAARALTLGPAALQFVGIALGVFVTAFYLVSLLELVKKNWARIAARVLGSWIAASGLLLLGWSLRPH